MRRVTHTQSARSLSACKFSHGVFKCSSMTHISSQGILLVSIVKQNKLDGKEPLLVTIVTTELLKVYSIWFKCIARINSGNKYAERTLMCPKIPVPKTPGCCREHKDVVSSKEEGMLNKSILKKLKGVFGLNWAERCKGTSEEEPEQL